MAELLADGADLVVHLTPAEKILGFHGDLRVPLTAVRSARAVRSPYMALRGWRMAGLAVNGFMVRGTRRHADGYDFCMLRRYQEAVEVDLMAGRFSRLVIGVPPGTDARAEADRISDLAGVAHSLPADDLGG